MQSKVRETALRGASAGLGRPGAWGFSLLLVSFLWGVSPVVSAEDYLSELASEARKVETRQIDSAEGKEEVIAAPAQQPAAPARSVDRAAFEGLLKEHYLGTYRFYKKLSERSREEIFEQYRGGADIGVIRSKIVARLLQE